MKFPLNLNYDGKIVRGMGPRGISGQRAHFNCLSRYRSLTMKIRWSCDCLVFIMALSILLRPHLHTKSASRHWNGFVIMARNPILQGQNRSQIRKINKCEHILIRL